MEGYQLHQSNGWETSYVRFNPATGIKTYIVFDHKNGKVIVRKTQVVQNLVDLNLAEQAEFNGFKGDRPYRVARIPWVERNKMMEACGYQDGEYDEAKYNAILDDRDNYKLKTIPGRIGKPTRMI
jgi:hypothetical protein